MKTVRDVMTTDVVWISPSARIKTAVILMKGHSIGALPVVQTDETVVGVVTYQSLLGELQEAAVSEVMARDFAAVVPDTPIHDAAEVMGDTKSSHLLVLDNGKLAGIVSHTDLIGELGRNFDPLTEMPWSDALREWAMNALKRGMEISLIFFDLDGYGRFNKRHGHVVGDLVIKEVADVIRKGSDPDLDFACRYGGDEFAIVSVRHADEAIALADILQERIARIKVEGMDDGVSGTYGMYGGRRTKEREDMHYAATIDDLITRASKECTARKPGRAEAATPQAAPSAAVAQAQAAPRPERLKIESIAITTTGTETSASVTLGLDDKTFTREVSGYTVSEENMLRLVAEAAAGAASKSLAPGHGIAVDEVALLESGRQDEIVTVAAVFISPKWTVRHVGCATVRRGDRHRAAAAALLAAVNRQVEYVPRAEATSGLDREDRVEGQA